MSNSKYKSNDRIRTLATIIVIILDKKYQRTLKLVGENGMRNEIVSLKIPPHKIVNSKRKKRCNNFTLENFVDILIKESPLIIDKHT